MSFDLNSAFLEPFEGFSSFEGYERSVPELVSAKEEKHSEEASLHTRSEEEGQEQVAENGKIRELEDRIAAQAGTIESLTRSQGVLMNELMRVNTLLREKEAEIARLQSGSAYLAKNCVEQGLTINELRNQLKEVNGSQPSPDPFKGF